MASSYRYKMGEHISCIFIENPPPNDDSYDMQITGYGAMYTNAADFVQLDEARWNYRYYLSRCKQDILEIPDHITYIANAAFNNLGGYFGYGAVKYVIIGEDVEEIGNGAFACGYDSTNADLDYLPHGQGAVLGITVKGDKVKKLGVGCFGGQTEVTDIDFHGSVELIGNMECFEGCHNLERLNLADDWEFTDASPYIYPHAFRTFWKCLKLWRISENNTICDVLNESGPYTGGNYYGCESLQSITIRNTIDDFSDDPYTQWIDTSLFVRRNHGTALDSDGCFITELDTPFQQWWEFIESQTYDIKEIINRVFVHKSSFSVYVYHMGRIIELKGGDTGDIPVAHEGQWKYLRCAQDSENPAYSPIHFAHNGHWYQFKY